MADSKVELRERLVSLYKYYKNQGMWLPANYDVADHNLLRTSLHKLIDYDTDANRWTIQPNQLFAYLC